MAFTVKLCGDLKHRLPWVCGATYPIGRLCWCRHSTRFYVLIFVLIVLLLEGQTGEAWETANKAVPAVLSYIIRILFPILFIYILYHSYISYIRILFSILFVYYFVYSYIRISFIYFVYYLVYYSRIISYIRILFRIFVYYPYIISYIIHILYYLVYYSCIISYILILFVYYIIRIFHIFVYFVYYFVYSYIIRIFHIFFVYSYIIFGLDWFQGSAAFLKVGNLVTSLATVSPQWDCVRRTVRHAACSGCLTYGAVPAVHATRSCYAAAC